jgi:hypothetical protein
MDIITHLESQQTSVSKDCPPPETGASQKEASVNDAKSLSPGTLPPVVVTTYVVSEDELASQLAFNEAAPLNSGSLTPSGPPAGHQKFSLQDFHKSFYDKWMKDKSIEKSNPFGFHSANATPSCSRSQSPPPISYAQSLARKGSLSGGHN